MRIVIAALLLSGCASYEPKTVEGAQCKQRCASEMAICQGGAYTCDRAASACYQACQSMEAMKHR